MVGAAGQDTQLVATSDRPAALPRKHAGLYDDTATMLTLLGTFYAAMVAAGYLVELIFGAASLIPSQHSATVIHAEISWNYTTRLNIVFVAPAAVLVVRFVTTSGIPMLRMTRGYPDPRDDESPSPSH